MPEFTPSSGSQLFDRTRVPCYVPRNQRASRALFVKGDEYESQESNNRSGAHIDTCFISRRCGSNFSIGTRVLQRRLQYFH